MKLKVNEGKLKNAEKYFNDFLEPPPRLYNYSKNLGLFFVGWINLVWEVRELQKSRKLWEFLKFFKNLRKYWESLKKIKKSRWIPGNLRKSWESKIPATPNLKLNILIFSLSILVWRIWLLETGVSSDIMSESSSLITWRLLSLLSRRHRFVWFKQFNEFNRQTVFLWQRHLCIRKKKWIAFQKLFILL